MTPKPISQHTVSPRTITNSASPELIAPCGINCRLCRAYQRDRNTCPGCRSDDALKPKTRVICQIKNCEKRASGKMGYCGDCDEFPCARLVHLDKRYRTKYGTSPIDNLRSITDAGIGDFIEAENEKWTCPKCGVMLCMHEPACVSCGYAWREQIDTNR